jgi:hypothetical protein
MDCVGDLLPACNLGFIPKSGGFGPFGSFSKYQLMLTLRIGKFEAPLTRDKDALGNDETCPTLGTLNIIFQHDLVGDGFRRAISSKSTHSYGTNSIQQQFGG